MSARQDGHDPDRDENCATGLCEHERGPAFPAPQPRASSDVMKAFWRGLIYRDNDQEEGQR